MTTVVLGWDALDHEMAGRFGLRERFGPHHKKISTFENDALGTPHTREIWPSIITGAPPEDHGLYTATEEGGLDWNNPLIDKASELANGIVPHRIRLMIGRTLRNRGAEIDAATPDHYDERGLETVFDGRPSRAIAIPNYRVENDETLDLEISRKAQFSDALRVLDNGGIDREDGVSIASLEERLAAELGRKIGVVESCLMRDYDMIFVWMGYLDTVGHLAPGADESGWQERAYHHAARVTDEVRSLMADGDTLVCVSDHGMMTDGKHSHHAFLGSSDKRVLEGVHSVLGVRDGLERVTPSDGHGERLRDAYRYDRSERSADTSEVADHLSDLGYI